MPIIEVTKPKENIIREEQNIKLDKLDLIIKLYSKSCNRIVKTLSGALLVELDDKTLYFNSNGINEFNLPKDVAIIVYIIGIIRYIKKAGGFYIKR